MPVWISGYTFGNLFGPLLLKLVPCPVLRPVLGLAGLRAEGCRRGQFELKAQPTSIERCFSKHNMLGTTPARLREPLRRCGGLLSLTLRLQYPQRLADLLGARSQIWLLLPQLGEQRLGVELVIQSCLSHYPSSQRVCNRHLSTKKRLVGAALCRSKPCMDY